MWWKIYFWLTIVEVFIAAFSIFIAPGDHIFTQIVMDMLFFVAIIGLYGYVFQKRILTKLFWQYFFGIYILTDILYLIYAAAPHAPLISSLVFLEIYKDSKYLFLNAVIGVVIDIPLLYAMYRITKGEVYQPKTMEKKKEQFYRWGMIQMALWGYSLVITFFLFILAFFPGTNSSTKGQIDLYSLTFITVLFAPLLLFWLWVIVGYKHYRWNWWRTTLVANALLYSGSIIFDVLVPPSSQRSSGFDFISIFQLGVLLLSLYVFGREQLKKVDKPFVL